MNRYATFFRKVVEIEKTIPLDGKSQEYTKHIFDFLTKQGYRDISGTDTTFTGVRGHKLLNLFNVGDPRRLYHTISVTLSDDAISVMIQVDSWYGLGTEHDISVFVAEVEMLKNALITERMDNTPLIEAQKRRRKSDWKIFFILVGVAILIAVLAICIGVTVIGLVGFLEK